MLQDHAAAVQECVWCAWMLQGTGKWYRAVMQQRASLAQRSCSSIIYLVQYAEPPSLGFATNSFSTRLSVELLHLMVVTACKTLFVV